MSILNITNLTDTPEKDIYDNFINAFEEVEKEIDNNKLLPKETRIDFINEEINILEERMEEAQGRDLLGIIDNYIVNSDYYAIVKDYYDNQE